MHTFSQPFLTLMLNSSYHKIWAIFVAVVVELSVLFENIKVHLIYPL